MSQQQVQRKGLEFKSVPPFSLVLPVHNEAQVIAKTISDVLSVVSTWTGDFELIVVDDGSTDATATLLSELCRRDQRVHVVTHAVNRGYGGALVSGFASATKELTFFMDADGQFDIRDLNAFFLHIDSYDAVIGYRVHRQDTWMRKLYAWGWKLLIGLVLDIHVRDLDCAFKLLHTDFLRQHPCVTRGAMINAELLYALKQAGCTCKELGVHHLPRRAGRATGANLRVILRAFSELFMFAQQRHRQEAPRGTEESSRESSSRRTQHLTRDDCVVTEA